MKKKVTVSLLSRHGDNYACRFAMRKVSYKFSIFDVYSNVTCRNRYSWHSIITEREDKDQAFIDTGCGIDIEIRVAVSYTLSPVGLARECAK